MDKFLEAINDIIEIITGKRPETPKPKRARDKSGKFKGDDKSTKDRNEAWEGGKAPKKKTTKRKPRKK